MKQLLSACATVLAGALISGAVLATEIENQDESVYEVTVTEGGERDSFTIGPGMKEIDLCTTKCVISVEGRGEIEADPDDMVLIRDGKLIKRL